MGYKKMKGINDYVSDKLKSIFPDETISNSMTIATTPKGLIFRPNNYRRQINVKTKTNSTLKKIKSAIKTSISCGKLSVGKHNKILSIKNYNKTGITLQYGKKKLTGIYPQPKIGGVKECYLIKRKSIKEIDERIDELIKIIQKKIDSAMFDFIRKFKIKKHLEKPKWSRYEDFLKGEEFIKLIPNEVIIHDTHFKKVYKKGIEFKNSKIDKEIKPGAKLKNFIRNQTVEGYIENRISKKITNIENSIKNLNGKFLTPKQLIRKINNINDFQKYKNIIKDWDNPKIKELETLIFKKFKT